jgi:hypothetical protein
MPQKPQDLFFAWKIIITENSVAVIYHTELGIARDIFRKALEAVFFNVGDKRADLDLVGRVHIFAARRVGAFPTSVQAFFRTTVVLEAAARSQTLAAMIIRSTAA